MINVIFTTGLLNLLTPLTALSTTGTIAITIHRQQLLEHQCYQPFSTQDDPSPFYITNFYLITNNTRKEIVKIPTVVLLNKNSRNTSNNCNVNNYMTLCMRRAVFTSHLRQGIR